MPNPLQALQEEDGLLPFISIVSELKQIVEEELEYVSNPDYDHDGEDWNGAQVEPVHFCCLLTQMLLI